MFQGKGSSCTRDAELGVSVPCNNTRLAVLSEPTSVDSRPRMSATVTLSLLAQPCECHHVPRPTSLARTHTGAGSAGGMETVVQPLRPLPVDRPAGRRGSKDRVNARGSRAERSTPGPASATCWTLAKAKRAQAAATLLPGSPWHVTCCTSGVKNAPGRAKRVPGLNMLNFSMSPEYFAPDRIFKVRVAQTAWRDPFAENS